MFLKNKFTNFKVFIAIFLSFLSIQNSFANQKNFDSNIAIIDIQYILEHSLAVRNLTGKIKIHKDVIVSYMDSKEKELKSLESKLKENNATISNGNFSKEIESFNIKVKEVQEKKQVKQTALQTSYAKSMKEINDKTTKIVQKLSKKYGFKIVIPSSQLYYASPDIDITKEVISILNEELPEIDFKVMN